MVLTSLLFVSLVVLYTASAAAIDIRLRRIPNYLTVPSALGGLLFHSLMPNGWGPLTSLAGFGVGFLLLLVPWLLGGGGMGDVKLLAALGAWLGPRLMLVAFATSIIMAAMMAMGVLVYTTCTTGVTSTKKNYLAGSKSNTHRSTGQNNPPVSLRVLPFAVPVAMSTWIVLAWLVSKGQI